MTELQVKRLLPGDFILGIGKKIESIRDDGGDRVLTFTDGTVLRINRNRIVEIF